MNGLMKDVQVTLHTEDRNLIVVKSAYFISDVGFLQIGTFMDPRMIQSWASDDIRWADYLESIRKDMECVFGILKKRFRFLWGYNKSKHYNTVENAFKICCILRNMILDYDRGYHKVCRAW